MDIKQGDIIFVNTGSWFSRIINLVQTGKFGQACPSHVAVVASVYSTAVMLIEASLQGVRIIKLDNYNKAKIWVKRIKDPKDVYKGLILVNDQVGTKYDFFQLGGILARAFFRLFGKCLYEKSRMIRNLLDSKTRFICSEVGYLFIQEATGKTPWHSHISQVTPFDLFRSELLEDVEN